MLWKAYILLIFWRFPLSAVLRLPFEILHVILNQDPTSWLRLTFQGSFIPRKEGLLSDEVKDRGKLSFLCVTYLKRRKCRQLSINHLTVWSHSEWVTVSVSFWEDNVGLWIGKDNRIIYSMFISIPAECFTYEDSGLQVASATPITYCLFYKFFLKGFLSFWIYLDVFFLKGYH